MHPKEQLVEALPRELAVTGGDVRRQHRDTRLRQHLGTGARHRLGRATLLGQVIEILVDAEEEIGQEVHGAIDPTNAHGVGLAVVIGTLTGRITVGETVAE